MKNLILGIVLEGIKVFGEERRMKFKREYHNLLQKYSNAENEIGDGYSDAIIDVSHEEIMNLLKAYGNELKDFNSPN